MEFLGMPEYHAMKEKRNVTERHITGRHVTDGEPVFIITKIPPLAQRIHITNSVTLFVVFQAKNAPARGARHASTNGWV